MVQASHKPSRKINDKAREHNSIESDIVDWITTTLTTIRPEFGNMAACPFAYKTLASKKLIVADPPLDMISTDAALQDDTEVVIYYFDPDILSATELSLMCNEINKSYPHLVALEDHPEELEEVAGYVLNQGTWALMLIQRRDKLEQAREKLKQTDYYKHWSAEYLADVLGH